jgi:adenosine kinase
MTDSTMKIAVLGGVCYDEIFALDGSRSESFGGILYNVSALSSVLNPDDRIVPLTNLGTDRYDEALAELTRYPQVDTRAIASCDAPLTHVTLTWKTVSWRDEIVRNRMDPVTPADVEKIAGTDVLHVNFINGTEIDLATMAAFRAAYAGLITFDVHSIISRFDAEGQRTIVGFPQWRDWVPHIDVLQCNEFEIDQMIPGDYATRDDYIAAAKTVCEAGPRAVSVTLGPEGAVMVHRVEGAYYVVDIGVLPPVEAVDTTGCGDSYGAGFLLGMLQHDDPATAVACASIVAGVNARHRGLSDLAEAKEYLKNPRAHFEVYAGKADDWPGELFG